MMVSLPCLGGGMSMVMWEHETSQCLQAAMGCSWGQLGLCEMGGGSALLNSPKMFLKR